MGLTRLRSFLRRHRRITLDTSVFIYQLESHPRYSPYTDPVFSWIERAGHTATTSTITMTELLVQPMRESNPQLVDDYYALLSTYPNLEWIAPNLEAADIAARLRALHQLRTPDALQAACAIQSGASGLISNDAAFTRVDLFETLVLDRLLET